MKSKTLTKIYSRIILFVLAFALVFSLVGCDGGTAPVVSDVSVTVEAGHEVGELNATHTLSYKATDGSTVTVSVKKGTAEATSSDYSYTDSSKALVFKTAGKYTVTVKATSGSLSDEESITVTAKAAAPTVSGVSLTAAAGEAEGRTEAKHIINYTATTGSEISVEVLRNGVEAVAGAEGDYEYTAADHSVKFHREGYYTVVVVATKDAQTARASAGIQIDPAGDLVISRVSLGAAQNAISGKVGEAHKLNYSKIGDVGTVSVAVYASADGTTWGQTALTSGYTYDETAETISFAAAGYYKVTVSGSAANTVSGSAVIQITDYAKPNITLSVAPEVYELESTSLVSTVTYDNGDSKAQEATVVTYALEADATFVEADEEEYVIENGKFTPKSAGYFNITVTATSTKGVENEKTVHVHAKAHELSMVTPEGTQRIEANKAYSYDAVLVGNADNYNYSLETDSNAITVENNKVNVNFPEIGVYTAKIKYIHKNYTDLVYEFVYRFSVVEDVQNAPIFVGDPFGDMCDTLIPNVGLLLYTSATAANGDPITDISYELVGTPAGVSIARIAGNNNYGSYIVATNASVGSVEVKVTVSDGTYAAAAVKEFKVKELGSGEGQIEDFYTYLKMASNITVEDLYKQLSNGNKGINKNSGVDHRNKSIVTKEGLIFNRENNNGTTDGDTITISVGESASNRKNFVIEYDYTLLAGNSGDNDNCSVALFFVPTGGWGGNATKFGMYKQPIGSDTVHCWNWDDGVTKAGGSDVPASEVGKRVHIRISHTVSDSTVEIKFEWKLIGDDDYTTWLTATADKKDDGTKMGSPTSYFQFTHEKGCYAIENLTYTVL